MIMPRRIGPDRAAKAGKVLVGGIVSMPFIPLNKPSKYTVRSRVAEWMRCCKE